VIKIKNKEKLEKEKTIEELVEKGEISGEFMINLELSSFSPIIAGVCLNFGSENKKVMNPFSIVRFRRFGFNYSYINKFL